MIINDSVCHFIVVAKVGLITILSLSLSLSWLMPPSARPGSLWLTHSSWTHMQIGVTLCLASVLSLGPGKASEVVAKVREVIEM